MRPLGGATATPADVSRSWTRQLAILWAGQAGALSGTTFTVPFMPLLVESVGVHDPGAVAVWTGVQFTVSQGMQVIFAPIWGRVADRIGRKAMVVRAMLGVGCALIVTSFAANIWMLLGCRVLVGTLAGAPAATAALVASTAPPERVASSLGIVQSAGSIGGIMGPGLGAVMVPAIGLRAAYVAAGVFCLCAGMAVLSGVQERFTPPDRTVRPTPTRQVIREAGMAQPLITLVVLAFLAQSASISVTPSLPLRVTALADPHHVAATLGAASAVQAGCAALAAISVARIARRVPYRVILVAVPLCAAAAYLMIAMASSVGSLLLFVGCAGLATGMLIPSINTLLGRAAPAAVRAEVFGYSASLMAAGGATMPLMATSLVPHFGTPAPFFMATTLEVLVATWAARRLGAGFQRALPQPVPVQVP